METENETREIRFLGDLQRLSPLHGDVFVITCEKVLHREQIEYIRSTWEKFMPGRKLIFLDDGLKIGVIGVDA